MPISVVYVVIFSGFYRLALNIPSVLEGLISDQI